MASPNSLAESEVGAGPANPGAFWLSLFGLLIQGIAAIVVIAMYPFSPPFSPGFDRMTNYYLMSNDYYMMGAYNATGWYWLAALIVVPIVLVIGIVGVIRMNSSSANKVRGGSLLVIVAAIAAFPLMWGFWIGSILMFIGGIIGLATVQGRQ